MRTTVTSKGQITLPAKLRRRLGLQPGDQLEFDADAPVLVAYRVFDRERMQSVLGRGRKRLEGQTTEELLVTLRGPVDLP